MKLFNKIWAMVIALIISLSFLIAGCGDKKTPAKSAETQGKAQEKISITLFDVRHGDCILINDGVQNILIDTGHNKNKDIVLQKLDKLKIDRIHTLILSHHHADHIGNALTIAGKYHVGRIYDSGAVNPKNETSKKLRQILDNGEYNYRKLAAGDKVKFGHGLTMDVLSPGDFLDPDLRKDMNNGSLVMKLKFKDFTMMFTGDIENPTEAKLAEVYGKKLQADVLKVAHHGSKTSSNFNFISNVKPKYAVISCGDFEQYKHPNDKVVSRLENLGAKVYWTNKNGDIKITTDGERVLTIRPQRK